MKKNNNEYLERIIFKNNYHRLYRLAYSIIKDRHTAHDIVQETFMKAFEKLHTLKDEEKFESWLAVICSRKAKDYLRKTKRWNDIAVENVFIDEAISKNEQTSYVETVIERKHLKKVIQEEILLLKPEFQEVLLLKYEYDLKDQEISKALNINIGTVKTRLHRAKKKLKEAIKDKEEIKEGI
ncbi:hypothetical protein BKP45_15285 [Anaerobacillus alkalidiazotrophicus]|uniref:RNA polymerase subunit sigma-70 n=1 Tax=Anaerobacillus alkalidiazotrophicus TaxID=472963 RepID=A0A1S2M3A4_9BACI|nr:hypothetical protein BKP45_15285 [Anaerobacillus alkalidiazotrophicus]